MPWESLKKERNAYVVFTCAGSSYVIKINPLSLHNWMTMGLGNQNKFKTYFFLRTWFSMTGERGGTNACLACKIGCKRVRDWNLGYRPLLSPPSLLHPPPLSPSWPMPISSAYIPNNPKTWQQLNIILITISVKIYWKQCHIVTPAYMHVSESYNNWKLSLQKREIFFSILCCNCTFTTGCWWIM